MMNGAMSNIDDIYTHEGGSHAYLAEEDTQECANFLLTLKHRSVTPEPDMTEETTSTSDFADSVPPSTYDSPRLSSQSRQRRLYDSDDGIQNDKTPCLMEEQHSPTWLESLTGDSQLISPDDRDLVPDSLYVAMAQMMPCSLTAADRVGCYKARELGFTGMCCKHCGGQPGFGKYFPATVRSLAQTTTSQTILKHISSKCRFCPPHVRQAVIDLQVEPAINHNTKDGSHSTSGRPRYGSRKVFFQRIWGRLHNEPIPEEHFHKDSGDEESSNLNHSDTDDDHSSMVTADDQKYENVSAFRRKNRFGLLPTQKSLKRKSMTNFGRPSKRSRLSLDSNVD